MPVNEQQRRVFQQVYDGLNPSQQKAVDAIEGPVLVIAGPGTGKTQILGARIAKILLDTDYAPQNILCLTYTDAGVVAMRRRLLSFIGADAYKVQLHTFHSFCNMVIQQNLSLFNKKELQALSELERIQFLKQLIDGFTEDNPLKRFKTDAYYEIPHLTTLFSAIKREGWSVDYLLEKIEDYCTNIVPVTDGLYNKRESKKGNLVLTQKGKDELQRMEKLKAAVATFPLYQQILLGEQRYDFDDMINWVIAMFQNNPDILLGYQEQLQFILVDEYQDTSGSQNRLVELLISYWQEEKPNIFVVGDDDQSIYRFQGANIENMMVLAKKYEKDLLRVVLTENYRSVQPILSAAQALIQNNNKRLCNEYPDLEKILTAANPERKALNILPEIVACENEFCENAFIAQTIHALIQNDVAPGNIAVIYSQHKMGDELIRFLQTQEISYYSKKSVNLLEQGFIKKILSLLHYVVAELDIPYSGEPILFEILHYDFFRIAPLRIARISNELAGSRNGKNSTPYFREYLAELARSQAGILFAQDETTDALIRVHASLEKLIKDVHNLSLQHWFEMAVNECGILSYIMNQPDKHWLMQLLTALFNYIKEETHRHPEMKLSQLVQQFNLLQENKLGLPLVQTSGMENGVNLLTAHGSKGLEFEYVFLMSCNSHTWEKKRRPNQGFKLPHNVFAKETPAEEEEELRRLFFVAMTRAEKHLCFSYSRFSNDGKMLEPSQFLEEVRLPLALDTRNQSLTDEMSLRYGALRFGMVQKPEIEKAEKAYISGLLENFVMNVTALNNYLDCPLKFYYSSLVRVPSAKSESAQFGSNVHDALSDYANKMMEENRTYPPKEFLQDRFRFYMHARREIFSRESLERFTTHGVKILGRYYDQYYSNAATGDFIKTEYPLTKVTIESVPVKGFADKIQFWGTDIMITDYKTGSLKKSNARYEFAPAGDPRKPEGGNYWRQAVFYKILAENLPGKNYKVLSTQFDYVEPNSDDAFDLVKIEVTAEDRQAVTSQTKMVWEKIQAQDFYTGCGKPECEWCNFVKDNKIFTQLHEDMEEEMPE
jgi:DNA helicase II / ATP-dependent DNA helicase PcrA